MHKIIKLLFLSLIFINISTPNLHAYGRNYSNNRHDWYDNQGYNGLEWGIKYCSYHHCNSALIP